MRDLFVYTADADALAVLQAVLNRPKALGIRPITFSIDRHTGRDPGMMKDGPETIRWKVRKDEYSKVLTIATMRDRGGRS